MPAIDTVVSTGTHGTLPMIRMMLCTKFSIMHRFTALLVLRRFRVSQAALILKTVFLKKTYQGPTTSQENAIEIRKLPNTSF